MRKILRRLFGRRAVAAVGAPERALAPPRLDPWFDSHYNGAANVILKLVPTDVLSSGRRVVDFGCGDGITAFGMASRIGADVFGVDLHPTYLQLPAWLEKSLGTGRLPPNLHFRQNVLGERLPFPDEFADLAYSWSVFEHLSDVPGILGELHRLLKPKALLFLQIDPLYASAYGSHLQRLVDEPWAHLLYDEAEYLRMAEAAKDNVPESEKDTLYRTHAFDKMKAHLIGEFKRLNRITADGLAESVTAAGFEILVQKRLRIEGLSPPAALLARYPADQLLTNQVVMIARRLAAATATQPSGRTIFS